MGKEFPPGELIFSFARGEIYPSGKLGVLNLRRTPETFRGGLNENHVYSSEGGNKFVLRVPRGNEERQATVLAINEEYKGVGAENQGIEFRLRTLPEQAAFIDKLNGLNIPTIDYLHSSSDSLLMPFINGVPLNKFISKANVFDLGIVVDKTLDNILLAHKEGVVFGDRWVANTMVLPSLETLEMDFDIELIADFKTSATFELSQMLYHLVHFANGNRINMIEHISKFLNRRPTALENYDTSMLIGLLEGYMFFFGQRWEMEDKFYEGIIPPCEETEFLISVVKRNASAPKKAAA
ncbi:hypothetical protein C4559_02410 [Candidatus Microgenomates bacterium]|nr:MAG: hypothetical protein C4559_02410 [Candidatus Microgenomates bacterium]